MKKSIFLAFLIAVLATLWILSGFLGSDDTDTPVAQAQETEKEEQPFRVSVRNLVSQDYIQKIRLNGVTKAKPSVALKAEVSGKVTELLFKEGDEVKAGDVILRLDAKDKKERVQEAKKRLRQRQIEYNASQALKKKGYQSKINFAQAATNLDAAKAALKSAEDDLSYTQIIAPFDGVLAMQDVENGDYVSPSEEGSLFTLVKLNPIMVRGSVSEHVVQQIKQGGPATVRIHKQLEREGIISYISPVADPNARTFEIQVMLNNDDNVFIDGLTAEITVPLPAQKAYHIAPSSLTLNSDGYVGVKAADENDTVVFYPVKILSDRVKSTWVSGLPDQIRLINYGQDFVREGSKIIAEEYQGDSEQKK